MLGAHYINQHAKEDIYISFYLRSLLKKREGQGSSKHVSGLSKYSPSLIKALRHAPLLELASMYLAGWQSLFGEFKNKQLYLAPQDQ